jgi:hypothetical protein
MTSPRLALLALLSLHFPSCTPTTAAPAPTTPSALSALSAVPASPALTPAAPLTFSIDTGDLDNHFFRHGPVAAHVLAASGRFPRILFAFPAGDCGAGLWFDEIAEPASLTVDEDVTAVTGPGGLRGVSAVIQIGAAALQVRGAALGSIRALRQYAATGTLPPGFEAHTEGEPLVVLRRTMLDGYHVTLTLQPERGARVSADASGRITATASPGATSFALRATALTDEPPLSPIPVTTLLDPAAAAGDPQSRDALAFLSFHEKLLAGSWRFLTYFGRDTLLSLDMLLPALTPAPIEAGLGSVLDRLGPAGEVAHEEAIGEWAVLENRAAGHPGDPRAPVLDYSMIDDDFLLAPVLVRYLLDTPAGRAGAAAFLARRTAAGVTYREAVRANLARVLSLAAPFAASRARADLVALKPGTRAGNWRDSDTGLGGGRFPYDVDVALVPAALEAAARLFESPVFGLDPASARTARAREVAFRAAGPLFRVEVPEHEARVRVAAYAATLGLDPAPALASLDGPVVFDALSLDAAGAPVPVLHSDVAFRWLFDAPSSAEIVRAARRVFAPFPAGLLTPLGVVVANPAFAADPAVRAAFTPHDYHGTVVWSWQQALLAAGIDRQLARGDLSLAARLALGDAETALWKVIRGTQALGMGTAELWSFRVEEGRFVLVPFGEGHGDADESNAVQLWSTVYLAVRPSR